MSILIYLDESGDLGWNFGAPYLQGGSSRHLTIGALCVPPEKKHLPKRIVKRLYGQFGWNPSAEKKWADMSPTPRRVFAEEAKRMCDENPDICMHGIVVRKPNVMAHIRTDSNKLYNYMIRLSLMGRMATHDVVTMIPDPRSIKVKSGNSMHDYLQMVLWFDKNAITQLVTDPKESHRCLGIQFADMLSGAIQSRFEFNDYSYLQILSPKVTLNRLFF